MVGSETHKVRGMGLGLGDSREGFDRVLCERTVGLLRTGSLSLRVELEGTFNL